jgi:hypothetical protein
MESCTIVPNFLFRNGREAICSFHFQQLTQLEQMLFVIRKSDECLYPECKNEKQLNRSKVCLKHINSPLPNFYLERVKHFIDKYMLIIPDIPNNGDRKEIFNLYKPSSKIKKKNKLFMRKIKIKKLFQK